MAEHEASMVTDYLDMTVEMADRLGQMSVDRIIRSEGKPWRNISRTLPRGVERGPMGNCFGNALNAVLADPHLIYVEGYAYPGYFPMQHAWVVDGNGTVYDPTWTDAGDYFGVAFDTEWLRAYVRRSGYTSVFGTEFFHDGLLEILSKGHLPDEAINSTGSKRAAASRTFYRLHHRNKPWTVTPTSQEFRQTGYDEVRRRVGPVQQGYSCFENPWHLFDYVTRRRWHYTEDEVVAFPGHEVARGIDDEPLAVPEGQPSRRMDWTEFTDWVMGQPMGSPPEWKGGRSGVQWGSKDHYIDTVLKTYDKAVWSRLTGITEVVIGRTRTYPGYEDHPNMQPVWYVREVAGASAGTPASKTLVGGLPNEKAARDYCRQHDLTIVGTPVLGAKQAQTEDYSDHAMICLKPSEAIRKIYADLDECTEDVDDLHITLYYLGTKDEAGGERGKERLYRGLYDFAIHAGYSGLTGNLNGFGCFMNADSNALIALWDIPGIAEFRTRLMGYCTEHGAELRTDDHGFTPHMTLAHDEDRPFLRLPRLPKDNPEQEVFDSVWLVWGEEWTEVTLP